jgi:hypothetical protein
LISHVIGALRVHRRSLSYLLETAAHPDGWRRPEQVDEPVQASAKPAGSREPPIQAAKKRGSNGKGHWSLSVQVAFFESHLLALQVFTPDPPFSWAINSSPCER